MYDIGVAIRRFRTLIKWVAVKRAIPGHPKLSSSDLEAEGYLILVRCCQSFPEGETQFARYFKRAFYNHLRDIFRDEFRKKRVHFQVDLSEAMAEPYQASSLGEEIESLRPMLSERAHTLLQQLADPGQAVIQCAYLEFLRRNKLRQQGMRISGYKYCRIRLRHIRKALGWSRAECKEAFLEIQKIYQIAQRGGVDRG